MNRFGKRALGLAGITLTLAGITFGMLASSPAHAATTAQAAPQNARVYGPHGSQCFVTNAPVPTQYDYWSPKVVGAMTTIGHLRGCTTFYYVSKTEHLIQGGTKNQCLTFVHDGGYYVVQKCLPHDRKSQKAYFSSVDHGKRAEIHFRYNGRYCVTFNSNILTQNPPGATLKPETCGANDQDQFFYWHNPARKHRSRAVLAAAQAAARLTMHRQSARCWLSNTLGGHFVKVCYRSGSGFSMTTYKKPPACSHCHVVTTAYMIPAGIRR